MSSWIFTCDPNEYRIFDAFKNLDFIYWSISGRNYSVKTNDTIYLYISAPEHKILFKTVVIDDQINVNTVQNDTDFSIAENDSSDTKIIRYVRLKLLIEFDKNIEEISLSYLVNAGYLKSHPQGKMKLDGKRNLEKLLDSISQSPNPALLKTELKSVLTSIVNKNSTETSATVKVRIGQGLFRESLISDKGCKCEICNIAVKRLLYASHIKPWSESSNSDRIDPNNGLLLCSLHNDLFDKGYITFDRNGDIIISQYVINYYDALNIDESVSLTLSQKQKKYMEWHRKNIFIK